MELQQQEGVTTEYEVAAPVFQFMGLMLVLGKCYLCSHSSLEGLVHCDRPIQVPYRCIYHTCIGAHHQPSCEIIHHKEEGHMQLYTGIWSGARKITFSLQGAAGDCNAPCSLMLPVRLAPATWSLAIVIARKWISRSSAGIRDRSPCADYLCVSEVRKARSLDACNSRTSVNRCKKY